MSTPESFTFQSQTVNSLSWTVADSTGPINTAVVTATLFWGRDRLNPETVPGAPVPGFDGLTLVWDADALEYSVTIPATFDAPKGGDYVAVIDVVVAAVPLSHSEILSVVI